MQQLMESIHNTTPTVHGIGKKKASLTPRELIKYHIENPGEPITDEDIQNLVLDYQMQESEMSRQLQSTE